MSWGPVRQRFIASALRAFLADPVFARLPPWLISPVAEARAAVADAYRRRPAAVWAALALPNVHGPIQAAKLAGADPVAALLAAVPGLLGALAASRSLGPRGVFWGAPITELLVPTVGLGWGAPDRSVVGALFRDGEIDLGAAGTIHLSPASLAASPPAYLPLQHGGWLALRDNNPLRAFEAHPDKEGSLLDLGGLAPERWADKINEARALMTEVLPEVAAEHAAALACVVPVGAHGERSLSASYREVIGQVYVSYLDSALGLAEALIHETQHNQLNLLSLQGPLLINPPDALYASPVRPDPRPIWGVLLAVHAFVPVELLYRRIAETGHPASRGDRFAQRHEEIRQVNREGMEVLRRYAQPVGEGRALVEGMAGFLEG